MNKSLSALKRLSIIFGVFTLLSLGVGVGFSLNTSSTEISYEDYSSVYNTYEECWDANPDFYEADEIDWDYEPCTYYDSRTVVNTTAVVTSYVGFGFSALGLFFFIFSRMFILSAQATIEAMRTGEKPLDL